MRMGTTTSTNIKVAVSATGLPDCSEGTPMTRETRWTPSLRTTRPDGVVGVDKPVDLVHPHRL